jgi:hypothetical protein
MPVTTRNTARKNATKFQPKVETKTQVNRAEPNCEIFKWYKPYAMKTINTMQALCQKRIELGEQMNKLPRLSPKREELFNEQSNIFRDQLRIVTELYSNISTYCPLMTFSGTNMVQSMVRLFNVMMGRANAMGYEIFRAIYLLDLNDFEDRVLLDNVMRELANGEKALYTLILENEDKVPCERSRRHSVRQYYVGMDTNERDYSYYTYSRCIDIWEELRPWTDQDYVPEDDEDDEDEDEDYCDEDEDYLYNESP